MAVFEAIELEWKGRKYTIPPNRVLEAIAAIEDHITLPELDGERPKMAKLSRAFAAALRIAGARKVTADEVYEALFGEARDAIIGAGLKLMLMMLPPSARAEIAAAESDDGGGDEGKAPPPDRGALTAGGSIGLVQLAYRSLVGRDRAVSRDEFWRMQPAEVWWLIEARQKQAGGSEAEAEAARERAADYKAEAEEHGFQNVGNFWRWRAKQRAAGHG